MVSDMYEAHEGMQESSQSQVTLSSRSRREVRGAAGRADRPRSSSRPRSLDQRRAVALDRICARALAPFAGLQIPVDELRRRACGRSRACRATPLRSLALEQAEPAEDRVGAAGEPLEVGPRLPRRPACRAARRRAGPRCRRPAPAPLAADRPGLAPRVLEHDGSGSPSVSSSTPGTGPRTGCRAARGSPALRRARGEDEPAGSELGEHRSRSRARPTRRSPSRARG